ncbi:MAG: B12-binding domain-containing radical SAM protein [Nitrospirae bacterium]|nr:B12-binding domain-containing radical SAM protein [Nitrospirota bacterium]
MGKNKISSVLIVVPPLVRREAYTDNINRPDFESYRLVSPVEPMVVAADLLGRGFDVQFLDLGTYRTGEFEHLLVKMKQFRPDAVVMVQSILTFATSHDWDGGRVFQMARQVNPGCITVLTGCHATNNDGKAVQDGACDYSIKGEVDFAAGELLSALNAGTDVEAIAGVAARRPDGALHTSPLYPAVDLGALPLPAYQLITDEQKQRYYEMPEYGKIRYPEKSRRYRDIMTSRGCVQRCLFCCVSHLRGEKQRYRRKPLSMVMTEIEAALNEGMEEIHFFDDLFAENEGQILEFTNELKRRNLSFPWFVAQGMPMKPLTHDALAAMAETGMYRIICPLESGSDRVLKEVVRKPTSVGHNHDVIQWSRKLGLEIIGMYVVGMPGETRSEILDTVRFAEDHPEVDYSIFSIATPMAGTRLMKQVTEGKMLHDADKINRIIKRTVGLYHTPEFSELEMGIIRTFDWDRINFTSGEKREKYARMVGITTEELDAVRQYSRDMFYHFFPEYDGPLSFKDICNHSERDAYTQTLPCIS